MQYLYCAEGEYCTLYLKGKWAKAYAPQDSGFVGNNNDDSGVRGGGQG